MARPSLITTDIRARHPLARVSLVAACCSLVVTARADPTAQAPSGVPPEINPSVPEVGVTILNLPGSGTNLGTGAPGGGTASTTGGGTPAGSGSAYDQLMATSYGTAAAQDAAAANINVDALAAIGKAESNFQNVPTSNGSSSATGPWQITNATFMQYSNQYGLGYTPADMTNPADNAQVASYVISSYANTVSNATGP